MAGALSAAVGARTIVIVALTNDLSTTDDNTAMTIMKRRQRSLLKAERKISIVARHCEILSKTFWIFGLESVLIFGGSNDRGMNNDTEAVWYSVLD